MSASLVAQQILPLKVDCGDANGLADAPAGWALLSEVAAPPGVSLSKAPLDTVHVALAKADGSVPVPSDVLTIDPDQLVESWRLTALQLEDDTRLTVTGLPKSATVRVRLVLGAVSPWYELGPWFPIPMPVSVSRQVTVEEQVPGNGGWRTLVSGLRCATGVLGNSFATVFGGPVSFWSRVRTDGTGKLVLRMRTVGDDPLFLTAFEVHADEALPLVYHKSGGAGFPGPLVPLQPDLQAFAAKMAAKDFDGAQAAALAIADPFHRAVALCHLVGWLDGSRDGRFALLPKARAALLEAQPAHPAAAWLLDQADDLARALGHLEARGYPSAATCPPQGGTGFLNPDCAGQLKTAATGAPDTNLNAHVALRLLSGLVAGAGGHTGLADLAYYDAAPFGSSTWEPSPFYFAALKQRGATLAMINPQLSVNLNDPESVEFLAQFRDVFATGLLEPALGLATLFAHDVELPLFRKYAQLGQHPILWDDATVAAVLTPAQIDASWWGPVVGPPPAPPQGTQSWASSERHVRKLMRALADDWLVGRFKQGELGGGFGDDVELLLQLFPPLAGLADDEDARRLDALDAIAQYGLVDSGYVQDGYYSGPITDVEHAAEVSTDLVLALHGVFGHTRLATLSGFDTARHLKSSADPAKAWAGINALGRLRFKSSYFTTDGPSTDPAHAWDVALDGRALLPAVATAWHAPIGPTHPLPADLRLWASAWRDDALATGAGTNGKPKGFVGPVAWPAGTCGLPESWWSELGPTDLDLYFKGELSYPLEVLRLAYHTSPDADRWRYLLPAVRMFRAAMAWEDSGEPVLPAGGEAWAGGSFRDSKRFFALAAMSLPDLATDPTLTSVDDPDTPGVSPYVDAALIARLTEWIEVDQVANVDQAFRYAHQPVAPCGVGYTAKDSPSAEYAFLHAIPYLRAIWPLLTKHVMHTDRVFLNRALVLPALLSATTGETLTEGIVSRPLLRWRGRPGEPLDLSVLVNRRDLDDHVVSAFVHNFAAQPVTVDLLLDEALPPGAWTLQSGAATYKCDDFPAGSVVTTWSVMKRGAGTRTEVVLPPGLSLLKLQRDAPPDQPAAGWNLAADPPRLLLIKKQPTPVLRVSLPFVNAGSAPSPSRTWTLHAGLLLPDGSPWTAPGAPAEFQVASGTVPALPGVSGYTLAQSTPWVDVPVTPLVGQLLSLGFGLRFRSELVVDGTEHDTLDDGFARGWLPSEIPIQAP